MTDRPPEKRPAAQAGRTVHDVASPEELFYLAPEDFTAARDALARRLRATGERQLSDAVRRLHHPTATAWALNTVARTEPALVERLLQTGSELRAATREPGPERGRHIRLAQQAQRDALTPVVEAARHVLARRGGASRDQDAMRIAATLHAAVVDDEVGRSLRAGCLERDASAAGFGLDGLFLDGPGPTTSFEGVDAEQRTAEQRTAELHTADQRTAELHTADQRTAELHTADQRTAEPARDRPRGETNQRRNERRKALQHVAELEAVADRLKRRAVRLAGEADRANEAARHARTRAQEAKSEASAATEKVAQARREVGDG